VAATEITQRVTWFLQQTSSAVSGYENGYLWSMIALIKAILI